MKDALVLKDKNILLGVCGSIAAYKAGVLIRELRKCGANVRVVMTQSAQHFVTPLTFQALSRNPVEIDAFDGSGNDGMKHIELARWADAILIAPASANICAKLANGLADDLLSMVCSASDKLPAIAVAMNHQMWVHPATQDNINVLIKRGALLLGPASGDQACGDDGEGRMLEPIEITRQMINFLNQEGLTQYKVIITAGPTREMIDPVRYISNRSSGKMGFALAHSLALHGMRVVLIAGPVDLTTPANVKRIDVVSAEQMYQVALQESQDADIFVGCAAVCDYRSTQILTHKMKRENPSIKLELTENRDIIKLVGAKNGRMLMVGFAAETDNIEANAKAKLLKKKLDIIFANQIGEQDSGCESDYNKATAYWRGGQLAFERMTKSLLAEKMSRLIIDRFKANKSVSLVKNHIAR